MPITDITVNITPMVTKYPIPATAPHIIKPMLAIRIKFQSEIACGEKSEFCKGRWHNLCRDTVKIKEKRKTLTERSKKSSKRLDKSE